jgi:hypothetical protein
VSTQENIQEYGKGIIEENKLSAVKNEISYNTEREEQEGNNSSRTTLEAKTTESALEVTSS